MVDNFERSKRHVFSVSKSWQRSSIYNNLKLYLKGNLYKLLSSTVLFICTSAVFSQTKKTTSSEGVTPLPPSRQAQPHLSTNRLLLLYSNYTPLTSRTRSDTDLIHRWLLTTKTCLLPEGQKSSFLTKLDLITSVPVHTILVVIGACIFRLYSLAFL